MGDLVADVPSPLASRNHRLGLALGRGLDVAAAAAEVGQTAEGVATARATADIAARHGVDMPITRSVVAVDHGARIDEVTTAPMFDARSGRSDYPRSHEHHRRPPVRHW